MFYKQISICLKVKNMQKRIPYINHEHTRKSYKKEVTKWDTTRMEHKKVFGKCLLYAGKDLGKITSVTQQRGKAFDRSP